MANMDLGVAEHLYKLYHPMPVEIICYHCQQGAEKAIKALITNLGLESGMPKVHDLSFLLNQIHKKIKIEEKYYDYADTLTPYGVAVRYPHQLELDEGNAAMAIKYAKEIVFWVKKTIG